MYMYYIHYNIYLYLFRYLFKTCLNNVELLSVNVDHHLTSDPHTEQRSGQHLRGLLSREDHHHHRLHGLRLQSLHNDHLQAGGGKTAARRAARRSLA